MADWLAADGLQLGSADPGAIFAALDELLERPPWQLDALCAEPAYRDVNFFPERGEDSNAAKTVCARCLVADECARFAIEHGEAGIWGGTSRRQRKTLRMSLRRAA